MCNEVILICETNILLLPQTIAVVVAECKTVLIILGTTDKFTNVIANPFLYIENPSLFMLPTVCIL